MTGRMFMLLTHVPGSQPWRLRMKAKFFIREADDWLVKAFGLKPYEGDFPRDSQSICMLMWGYTSMIEAVKAYARTGSPEAAMEFLPDLTDPEVDISAFLKDWRIHDDRASRGSEPGH